MTYEVFLRRALNYSFLAIVLALIYFGFGILGQLLEVLPNHAVALWPATGIALAALLLLGKSLWLGIFLGNFVLSASAFGFDSHFVPIYIANATAASLCALLGCFLIEKTIGFPNPLIDDRSIILFMMLGGPLSCLIPPSIGMTVLYHAGIVGWKEIPAHWLSWWIGDTMGVLVFTPIFLIAYARPRSIWGERRHSVGLPLIATFFMVIGLYFYVRQQEEIQRRKDFDDQTAALSFAVSNRLQGDMHAIDTIRNFFYGSRHVEQHEFAAFTRQTLALFPEIKSSSWISIDHNAVKLEFSEYFHNYVEDGFAADYALSPSLHSLIKSRKLTSDETYLAVENGLATVLSPVFTAWSGHRRKLLGIIATSFTVGDLVQYATQTLKNAGCTFTIVSKDGRGGPDRLIYTNQAAGTPAPKTVKQYVTQAGGQRWEMSFFRDTALEHSQLSWPVWWVLISGLLFTSLLGAGLLMLTGRYFRTESLIEERTAQLEKARVAAEAANEAKSRFLANISHELRTPLNAILGFSQLLLKKRTLLKEDYEQINTIKHCSHHLLELITGILDIASIESNKVRTDIKVFDSHNLLTHIVDMCRLNAERKHLKLNIHATAMPRLLWGDQKRIRQVIVNLLDNAIKYTDQGGVALTSEYVDGQWRIIIEDSGRGIAEQDLESIFTPFTQLNEDEFIRPGLGLGLAITRELIHIMGGSITVKSQLGLGSTFAVSLPLRSADDGTLFEPDDSGTAQQAAGSLPVLIADDNQINLLLLANLLELEGCSVDAAANGREALALIESRAYRLALVDLNMPVMSGLELLKSVRSRGNALKMVAVSAYADENRINEALAAGFDAYLTKPIHDEELTALLNSLRA